MFSIPTVKSPTFPVSRPPPRMGTLCPPSRPILRLKKMVGALPPPKNPADPGRPPPPPLKLTPRPKSKIPRPSRKNSRFSGREQAEPCQVHLLLIHLDLREIGVVGEVGREVLRQAILDIDPEVSVALVRDERHGVDIGGQRADRIRFDLECPVAPGHLDPGQRGRSVYDTADDQL